MSREVITAQAIRASVLGIRLSERAEVSNSKYLDILEKLADEQENHFGENLYVTRKGAVRARKDDLGIIPGSMGQRSYIVRGKGNAESYCSCSHGAGRVMSRKAAEKHFTLDDVIAQTQGVECKKDKSVLDEIPAAYKDIDVVMANQGDLAEVVATLKQVLCVKG